MVNFMGSTLSCGNPSVAALMAATFTSAILRNSSSDNLGCVNHCLGILLLFFWFAGQGCSSGITHHEHHCQSCLNKWNTLSKRDVDPWQGRGSRAGEKNQPPQSWRTCTILGLILLLVLYQYCSNIGTSNVLLLYQY